MAANGAYFSTLASIPIFKGLSRDEIAELDAVAEEATFRRGATIFREKEPSDALYAILEGVVDIRVRDAENVERPVASLSAGHAFGELALLASDVHSATAIAYTDCVLWVLPAGAFIRLLLKESRSSHQVVYNLGQLAAQRLRDVNQKLVRLMAEHESSESRRHEALAELRGRALASA